MNVHDMNRRRSRREEELTLDLLESVGRNSEMSQRGLAREMGVALGLANSYLKRCIKKGLIKISEAPANRYLYYLTPKGFAEKSRLTAKYLAFSFDFYRNASDSCRRVFEACIEKQWDRVVLCGISDLAEIAAIRGIEAKIDITAVYDPEYSEPHYLNYPVIAEISDESADAFVITNYSDPHRCLKEVSAFVPEERILIPDLLRIGQAAGDET